MGCLRCKRCPKAVSENPYGHSSVFFFLLLLPAAFDPAMSVMDPYASVLGSSSHPVGPYESQEGTAKC